MKKFLMIAIAMVCVLGAWAKDEVTFDKRTNDFGTVKALDGMVTMTYEFTNNTDEPVSIVTVTNGGCGCTRPEYPLQPIAKGGKGTITIHFNPSNFKGEVSRSVKVQFSNSRKRQVLKFSGTVIPGKSK